MEGGDCRVLKNSISCTREKSRTEVMLAHQVAYPEAADFDIEAVIGLVVVFSYCAVVCTSCDGRREPRPCEHFRALAGWVRVQ